LLEITIQRVDKSFFKFGFFIKVFLRENTTVNKIKKLERFSKGFLLKEFTYYINYLFGGIKSYFISERFRL